MNKLSHQRLVSVIAIMLLKIQFNLVRGVYRNCDWGVVGVEVEVNLVSAVICPQENF